MKKRKNKRYPKHFTESVSKIIILIADILGILISLYLGVLFANIIYHFTGYFSKNTFELSVALLPFYIIIPSIFFYEGIYTVRFDFWQETKLVLKSLILSFIVMFAYLAVTHNTQNYSRAVIIFSFFIMMLLIPAIKNIVKKSLFNIGFWKLGVKIISNNADLEEEIFNNKYMGYIKSRREEGNIVFIDSQNSNTKEMRKRLEIEIQSKDRVMFIPFINEYQFSNSNIFELTDTRTNLMVLENRLHSKYRMFINITYNYILAIFLMPLLLPIVGFISWLVKKDSQGPAFFKQERLGINGEVFLVYKFRTMYINGDEILKKYLDENPQEVENYRIYHKYDNDPRITKIGKFLRKTSADELAQIINVFKGEMNFVGPRPYMVTERDLIGEFNEKIILRTKPGITGLWQVSGRNELTFDERITLDKWYINNWSLWTDFVILLKTVRVVLDKAGAK